VNQKNTFTKQDIQLYKKSWEIDGVIESMLSYYRYVIRYKINYIFDPKEYTFDTPILLIMGKDDIALDYNLGEASIKNWCKNGKFILYSATHWFHHTHSVMLNNDILKFFNN